MDYNKIPPYFENENDSRKKAKITLTQIFENKMLNIDTIKTIISEFQKYENQNSIEVFNRIERNINESEVSTKKIGDVIKHTEEVNSKYQEFFKNWEKITQPLNDYGEELENLMLSKKNVSMMRQNLNVYVKIKEQIKELKDLINSNPSNVVIVYKQIRYLAYLRTALLEKINKTRGISMTEKIGNLADHLLCVKQFEDEFFAIFWSYFDSILYFAEEKPEFLVKLLRLVEEDAEYMKNIQIQFQMYNKIDDKYAPLKNSISVRESTQRGSLRLATEEGLPDADMSELLCQKIKNSIDDKFYKSFADKSELNEILDETVRLMNDLFIVQSKVVQCFPPKYNIFQIYKEKYFENCYEKLSPYLNEQYLNDNKSNLILFAKWLDGFSEALKKVGIDIGVTEIGSEVKFYMHLFYDHVNGILEDNIKNILSKNFEDKETLRNAKNTDIEKIQSFYASDIFRSLFSVVELLSADLKGQLLYEICKVVIDKLKEVHTDNDSFLLKLNSTKDIVCSCIFTLDANSCLEIFPDFKKKIKSVLHKEFYERLKLQFNNVISAFNHSIKLGNNKTIELMFLDIEKNFISKLLTNEWNEDVLNGSCETFRSFFNRGFSKILKQPYILLILVRSYIDMFVNFYIEELIHSVRSLKRKFLTEGPLRNYQFKYLKLSADNLKYSFKEANQNLNDLALKPEKSNVKKLDQFVESQSKKVEEVKYKKYDFPVKNFSKESKDIPSGVIVKKIQEDSDRFKKFLESFKEGAKEPFSKNFTQYLGDNYIRTYLLKFESILGLLSCNKNQLDDDSIISFFKESFSGEDGKVLLEALLHVREDYKVLTKPDMKKFYLRRYDN